MNRSDINFIVAVVIIIGAVVGLFFGLAWWSTGIRIGATYRTVGVVRLYEQSSFNGEHTWIVLETVGGTSASFTLVGYHEFELKQSYDIYTVCERGGYYNLDHWYRVIEINEVS